MISKLNRILQASSSRRYRESDDLNIGSGIIAPKGDATNGVDIEVENGVLDTEMAELSLGQRLRATQRGEDAQISSSDSDSDAQTTKKGKKGRDAATIEVPTESLSRTLTQALHSSDAKLLEGCLRHSDPAIIQNTVIRLPPQLAVPLLQACVDRLARGRGGNTGRSRGSAASAQRGTVMIAWIKVVLVVHSGHLMTVCSCLLVRYIVADCLFHRCQISCQDLLHCMPLWPQDLPFRNVFYCSTVA